MPAPFKWTLVTDVQASFDATSKELTLTLTKMDTNDGPGDRGPLYPEEIVLDLSTLVL